MYVNKRLAAAGIAGAAVLALALAAAEFAAPPTPAGPGPDEKDKTVFHATLAGPGSYSPDGTFTETVTIDGGSYHFRFVPSGSSPETLTVTLDGPSFDLVERFELAGTLHETGISEYHTWEYLGADGFEIPESQRVAVTIDPNGNTAGSVSVYIVRN